MTIPPPNLTDFLTHFERGFPLFLRRTYWWPSERTKLNLLPSIIRTLNQLSSVRVTCSAVNTSHSNVICFADVSNDDWGAGFRYNLTQMSRHCMTEHLHTQITADLLKYSCCCVEAVRHRQSLDHAILPWTCFTWTSWLLRWVEWVGVIMQLQNSRYTSLRTANISLSGSACCKSGSGNGGKQSRDFVGNCCRYNF